jgi:methyltransferase, FkbM family
MDSDIFSILPTLKFSERPMVMEIGAAWGLDTQKIFDLLQPSEYFAFEPDPRNIIAFRNGREIQLIECAVGEQNAICEFNTSTGWNPHFECEHTLSGSLKEPRKHITAFPHCEFKDKINVRVIRLDDFIDLFSIPQIGFIWCDVQGAEDLVIQGGTKALSRTKYFFTEYYNEEMYEGQIGAEEIHRRLPGTWEVVKKWEADILFRNTNIE